MCESHAHALRAAAQPPPTPPLPPSHTQALLPPSARGCVQQCIGGANPARQLDALKKQKPLLVVGTPGRLAELSRSGALQTHGTRVLVLDEVRVCVPCVCVCVCAGVCTRVFICCARVG